MWDIKSYLDITVTVCVFRFSGLTEDFDNELWMQFDHYKGTIGEGLRHLLINKCKAAWMLKAHFLYLQYGIL